MGGRLACLRSGRDSCARQQTEALASMHVSLAAQCCLCNSRPCISRTGNVECESDVDDSMRNEISLSNVRSEFKLACVPLAVWYYSDFPTLTSFTTTTWVFMGKVAAEECALLVPHAPVCTKR